MKDDLNKELDDYYKYRINNTEINTTENNNKPHGKIVIFMFFFMVIIINIMAFCVVNIKENSSKNNSTQHNVCYISIDSEPDQNTSNGYVNILHYKNLDMNKTYNISYSFKSIDENSNVIGDSITHTIEFTPESDEGYIDLNKEENKKEDN